MIDFSVLINEGKHKGPFRIFDADGVPFNGYVRRIDANTGECWVAVAGPAGEPMVMSHCNFVEYPEGRLAEAKLVLKAPASVFDADGNPVSDDIGDSVLIEFVTVEKT